MDGGEKAAHACDVVFHGGYGSVRTLLGTYSGDILLTDQTPSVRLDQSGGL